MGRRNYTDNQIYYDKYKMNIKEIIKYFSIIFIISVILSYTFYKSMIATLVFLLPMHFYLKIISRYLVKKRKNDLTVQFKEFCLSLSASLITGYSLENSIRETYNEMAQMYGKESYICKELKLIDSKLKLSITIESCLEDFAIRCEVEEIKLFSEIIKIAKRTGGDIIEIVKDAGNSISQKIEVEREIKIIINSKKQEQMIMNFIPIVMISYVNVTSPDIMEVLYNGVLGRIIMTVCFGLYVFAVYLGNKFSDINM